MSSLSEAKKLLQFNREFVSLIGVLKGVAASQFQALARARQRFEKFKESFSGFFKLINLANINSPFIATQSDTTGVIILTSDEGFMGGLNSKVINAALAVAGSHKKELIVLGKRGAESLKDMKLTYTAFPGMVQGQEYEQAVQLKDYIVEQVQQKKLGKVILVYPYPVSLMVQRAEIVHLLPCGELVQQQQPNPPISTKDNKPKVILESSPEAIIKQLVGMWMTYRFSDIFVESKLAEYAARTTHLEQSHDRLTDQGKVLRYRYFRSRREVIDKGMRETFAAILLRRTLERD